MEGNVAESMVMATAGLASSALILGALIGHPRVRAAPSQWNQMGATRRVVEPRVRQPGRHGRGQQLHRDRILEQCLRIGICVIIDSVPENSPSTLLPARPIVSTVRFSQLGLVTSSNP